MKISVMSYTLSRRAEFKNNISEALLKMCRLAQELKIDGIDLVTIYGHDPKIIRQLLDEHGLKTICYTFSGSALNAESCAERTAGVDAVKTGIDTALALGTDKIMIITPGKKGVPRDISRRNYIRGLQECAGLARQAGLTMTIENFPGAACPFVISSDVLEAVREVPGLKLTYDNGNVVMGGEEPAASFRRCAEHIVHVHFKDWDLLKNGNGVEGLDGRQYAAALVGEGIIDHAACIKAMQEAGYSGYINIEYEGNKYPSDEATRKATRYLQDLIHD